jgi:succinoglycan biosynthesis protein ExoW
MIAIVIPFFQTRTGLLRQALESVLAQQTAKRWHVYIVDDGSPADPEPELRPLRARLGDRYTLLRRRNGGASSARNHALERLPPGQDVVAFLDSDDRWSPGHLERVDRAFAAGADFYFENYRRSDIAASHFACAALSAEGCGALDDGEDIYWFEGDFFDALLRGSPAGTPTIAYRFSRMPALRFRTDLSYCEDVFFWMQASRAARRIAFSPLDGAYCGRGVNISQSAWGTLENVRKLASLSHYHQLVEGSFSLSYSQRRWSARALQGLDRDFWRAAFAAGRRGEYRCLPLALAYLRSRPAAAGRIPLALAQMVQERFARPAAKA